MHNLIHLPGVIKLLFLLLDLAVNLLTNLAKLKLSPQNLVFLLLQGCLSLLKSSLKLFLLNLQPTPLFIQLMNGSSSISKLVKQILDLIREVLVLPLDNIKLLNSFIPSSLQPKAFTVVVAALLSTCLQLSMEIISLLVPLTNNLKKIMNGNCEKDYSLKAKASSHELLECISQS